MALLSKRKERHEYYQSNQWRRATNYLFIIPNITSPKKIGYVNPNTSLYKIGGTSIHGKSISGCRRKRFFVHSKDIKATTMITTRRNYITVLSQELSA
jgi:hypothetical protein